MKRQHKQANVAFKAILSLCLSGIVYSGISEWEECPIVQDVTLKTITVYIGEGGTGLACADTLIIVGGAISLSGCCLLCLIVNKDHHDKKDSKSCVR